MGKKAANDSHQHRRMFLLLILATALVIAKTTYSQTNVVAAVTKTTCSIYYALTTIIFILALVMFMLGGVIYATANLLPGQQRGGLQGYAMGMIMGAIIGLIIVVSAPFVINLVIVTGSANGGTVTLSNSGFICSDPTTGTFVPCANIATKASIAAICSAAGYTSPTPGGPGGPGGPSSGATLSGCIDGTLPNTWDCTCSGGGSPPTSVTIPSTTQPDGESC